MQTLTPEQFSKQYGQQALASFDMPAPKPAASAGDYFGKIVNGISNFTGGNTIGKGLGQAFAMGGTKANLDEIQQNQGDMQQKIITAIHNNRQAGKDTTKLEALLQSLSGQINDTGNSAGDMYNPNHITGKQVVGDALQLGTTIASFGTYGSAAEGAQTGKLLVKAPTAIAGGIGASTFKEGAIAGAKTGAIAGAGYGAASGLSQGLKKDQGAMDIAKSTLTGGLEGGVAGGVVGGLIGGISGALRGHNLRQDIIKAQEKAGTRPTLADTIKAKMEEYNLIGNKNADMKPSLSGDVQGKINSSTDFKTLIDEAKKQGFSDADINFLATISPEDRPTMQKMFDMTVKAQSDPRQITRAGDVLGESVIGQVNQVQKLNAEHGAAVDKAARALAGETVDATPVLQRADDLLSNAGVTVGDNGELDFSRSVFKKTPAIQKQLQNAFSDLPTGEVDGYELHKFKKSLDEVVNYGTNGEGLRGTSARILKGVRNAADTVLDVNPTYNEANTQYALTREYLDAAKTIAGKNVDLSSKEGAQAFGQALRSAFSNNKSRPNTLKFIEDTQLLSQQLGLKNSSQNILDQALYVNLLEQTFGSEASTGMAGEISKAIDNTKTVAQAIKNPVQGVLAGASKIAEKMQNITPEAKKAVLQSFLTDSTPRVGSLADEAAQATAKSGVASRLFDTQQTKFENLVNIEEYQKALDLAQSLVPTTAKESAMKKSLIKMAQRYLEP